jgi:hypothetical protein
VLVHRALASIYCPSVGARRAFVPLDFSNEIDPHEALISCVDAARRDVELCSERIAALEDEPSSSASLQALITARSEALARLARVSRLAHDAAEPATAGLPETTVPPTITRAQLATLFSLGVIFVPDGEDLGLRLIAGPAASLLVVAEDGRRWQIETCGKIAVVPAGEASRGD